MLPTKSVELKTGDNNKTTREPISNLVQKIPETDSDQLVSRLERLQDNTKNNSIAINIEEAIALGVKNNPDLEVAFRDIQALEWQLIAAKRRWFPKLSLNGGQPFTGYRWETFVENNYAEKRDLSTTQTTSETYSTQARATVSWDFLDLSRQADINAAEDKLRRQKLLFNVSARNLILRIQQDYYAIQSSAQLIESFKAIYAINRQQLNIQKARQAIGMSTILDVAQTESQLFSQLNQLVGYTQSYNIQAGRLAQSLALPPGKLAIPNKEAAPQGIWTQDLNQTIDEALKQREEVLASIAAAEAAEWEGIAALRKYLPVFSIQADGNLDLTNRFQTTLITEQPRTNRINDRERWSGAIGIGFRWNAFDGGISAANAQSQFAQSRKFLAEASLSKLEITQQVQSSYSQMETARIGIKSAEQAYRSAEIAQEAARARLDVGVGDIFSVVQAIGLLSSAAVQKSQSTLNYNNSIAELYRYSANWPLDSYKDVELRVKTNNQTTKP
ncbi:TolC family protein [Synechococcus sp. WH 8016]|uniref:TolC family protein n=1 Tax=Synechococcus sp. WH 8016 TaxID=166318 RepID=UPI00022D7ED7|nr:TolC family protein [Synechococcus sp. WH 8016]EHA62214.1 outer membrane efflux protein [Synechococcus sp. WH 8016]